jgi:TPR repeat protein
MKLIPLFLAVGMLTVSGWAEDFKLEPYSPELVKKAEVGYAVDQYNLGQCHEKGFGVIRDNKEAVKWYTKSAEQGYATAAFALSRCYEDGKGVLRDKNEAKKWFNKGVESGDENELLRILDPIYHGDGREGAEKRFFLYRRLAELGNAKAQYEYGMICMLGEGVTKDEKEALIWYMKASEQGDVKAQRDLGRYYANHDDVKEAVKWYTKAAEQGNAEAKLELEKLKPSEWYEPYFAELVKMAFAGDEEAWNSLGLCYVRDKGVTQDYKELVKWLTACAEERSVQAQFMLATCYYSGHGVAQDYKETVKWFTKSAVQGNRYGQCGLGFCYLAGKGVTQDYKEAVKWLTKSAEQGNALGQLFLGSCYSDGRGVTKDKKEAVRWYTKAAYHGNAQAKKELERLKSK